MSHDCMILSEDRKNEIRNIVAEIEAEVKSIIGTDILDEKNKK